MIILWIILWIVIIAAFVGLVALVMELFRAVRLEATKT
jgi:hypothetical protein